MAITYTWKVNQLYTLPNVPNMPSYVVNVLWTLTGTDGINSASISGSTEFAVDATQTGFISYSNLTEAIVIGWIQNKLGTNAIQSCELNVQGQLNSLINPPINPSNTPLPW